MSQTKTRIAKVGTVIIPVSDQDRAIEFYVETLGFEKRTDVPFGNGYRWVEVGPADAETTIAIVPPPPGKPTGNVETGIALHTERRRCRPRGPEGPGRRRRRGGQPRWATRSRRCSGSATRTATRCWSSRAAEHQLPRRLGLGLPPSPTGVWHALRRGPDRAAAGDRRLRALATRTRRCRWSTPRSGDDPRRAHGRAGVHGRRRGRPPAGDERARRGRARRRARDRLQRRVARGVRRAVRDRGAPARAGRDRHRRVLPRRARPARASGCRCSRAARRRGRARPCRAPRPGPRSSAAASRCRRATSCSATTTAS